MGRIAQRSTSSQQSVETSNMIRRFHTPHLHSTPAQISDILSCELKAWQYVMDSCQWDLRDDLSEDYESVPKT
ncbi:unnamed protein product [Heligmosomoides polygyrus]|uniref:Uncharacterized protein n=1 Tax=Heligmosomoides polygyrus TaxID=6339 RepID=A0A183G4U8_HELPZ|nr:unnamed protein product [Heligmosomoides polygyrus]